MPKSDLGDSAAAIRLIRGEIEDAADAIISAAAQGLDLVRQARAGEAEAFTRLEALFCAILEACAFQDLTGQRLAQLGPGLTLEKSADPLLAGPAGPGEGVSQAAADRLFDTASVSPRP